MTVASLGLRSSSYGSLQPLGNAASVPASVAVPLLPAPTAPLPHALSGRKPSNMLLAWIFKLAGRRRAGMLLVILASVFVFFSFFSVIPKDDDMSRGLETSLWFSNNVRHVMNSTKYLSGLLEPEFIRNDGQPNSLAPSVRAKHLLRNSRYGMQNTVSVLPHYDIPLHHPCENFSYRPPPSNGKRTGPRPCPVCYVPVEHAVAVMPAFPSPSPVLKNLSYISDESLLLNESFGGSLFGGHPSLQERNESFDIKESMSVHCGFIEGKKPGQGTSFDIDGGAILEMEKCSGVVVASAIFGNYDILQQPKKISEFAKRNVCFYMFVDEETEAYMKNTSAMDSTKKIGLWRVVVVRNLPYADPRRNGKIPKLLLHRIFPNARFSLWIDGKLELVVDPYQILERFLWRENASFAISRHYKRFDVFEEAEANKAAGKYDNASIDYQIEFYKMEGLTPYTPAKLPITSDVPEGCVIIREHTPITNLFTCLWFNEVERFTSRDQLSFSTVRDKIMSRVDWRINMFMDCERRNFVVQAYHRDVLEQRINSPISYPQSGSLSNELSTKSVSLKKLPVRQGKVKKWHSKRRHPKHPIVRDFTAA